VPQEAHKTCLASGLCQAGCLDDDADSLDDLETSIGVDLRRTVEVGLVRLRMRSFAVWRQVHLTAGGIALPLTRLSRTQFHQRAVRVLHCPLPALCSGVSTCTIVSH